PEADLPVLITAANAVALVSTYEGFGLPVLEAMACGTPVVISDTPALVEIAGGAARIAERLNPESIASQLASALSADREHDPYVLAGTQRAATFTWTITAQETIAYLDTVLNA